MEPENICKPRIPRINSVLEFQVNMDVFGIVSLFLAIADITIAITIFIFRKAVMFLRNKVQIYIVLKSGNLLEDFQDFIFVDWASRVGKE